MANRIPRNPRTDTQQKRAFQRLTGGGFGDGVTIVADSTGAYAVQCAGPVKATANGVGLALADGGALSVWAGRLGVNVDNATIETADNALRIRDGAITTAKIGDGQVTADKLGDGQITRAKIAGRSVDTGKLAVGAVLTENIADGQVTAAKLDRACPQLLYVNTADSTPLGNFAGEMTFDVTAAIPANFFIVGRALRVRATFQFSFAGTPTVQFALRMGGLAISTPGTPLSGMGSAYRAQIEAVFVCRSTGASGLFGRSATCHIEDVGLGQPAKASAAGGSTGTADTTAPMTVYCAVYFGTASPSNSATLHQLIVEALN